MIKVLIVEDEDIIRQGLVSRFNWLNMGAVVVADAKNGEVGLSKIKEFAPDVIITDIKMPKLDGLEMLKKAKELGYMFESIVLTSYTEFDFAKKSIDLKVFDYILKPVSEEKLFDTIKAISEKLEQDRHKDQLNRSAKNIFKVLDVANIYNVSSDNTYVTYALDRVKKYYSKKISITIIANELSVSPSYLSRVFKKVTNTTFLEFLNRYRVVVAMELLNSSKYKVYEVSSMVGFIEYKHFYKIFKKYTGFSPTNTVKKDSLIENVSSS